jgi:hypothetical protein
MSTAPVTREDRRSGQVPAWPIQTYARIAGALFLLTIVAGGFGEFSVPSKLIVFSDAAATAKNVIASGRLFRVGFASYLVEALCDTALALVLYVLLRPVHRNLALLASFFRLVSTAVFAGAELFYFAPLFILAGNDYLKTFSPAQLQSLALLSLKYYGYGADIFMVFYGVASIISGYLIFRSTYLPKTLGVLLGLGGLGFVARNFAVVLAPAYASSFLALPMSIAVLALTFWFLVIGVNARKWEETAGTSDDATLAW